MNANTYRQAYERQKLARIAAEQLLETRSRELFELNQNLGSAYEALKNQQTQLIHSEKLASVGLLAAGVAHEINNPAAFVKSNISCLGRYFNSVTNALAQYENLFDQCGMDGRCDESVVATKKDIRTKNDLEYILGDLNDILSETLQGMERIEGIVKSLRDFSRPDHEAAVLFNINTCVENTLKVAWNQIKYKATVTKKLEAVPEVLGQPGSMGQVILNLLVNATQAIQEFGEISISTESSEENVIIRITDTGCGIPADNLGKIFQPFFTTKDVGVGTGLGLTISHSIVQKHGGQIDVQSTVGAGTTFSIFLPQPQHE